MLHIFNFQLGTFFHKWLFCMISLDTKEEKAQCPILPHIFHIHDGSICDNHDRVLEVLGLIPLLFHKISCVTANATYISFLFLSLLLILYLFKVLYKWSLTCKTLVDEMTKQKYILCKCCMNHKTGQMLLVPQKKITSWRQFTKGAVSIERFWLYFAYEI